MIRPRPFKIYGPKCGFKKLIWFKSDALSGLDFEEIPQICPKCGNEKLEKKAVSIEEARVKQYFDNTIQSFKNIFKKTFKS